MLKSMTAFGRASASVNGREITVELRSVNNRFLDCSVRMPRTLGCQDDRVKPYLTSRGITRGKVDVNVSVGQSESEQIGLGIDEQYAYHLKILSLEVDLRFVNVGKVGVPLERGRFEDFVKYLRSLIYGFHGREVLCFAHILKIKIRY